MDRMKKSSFLIAMCFTFSLSSPSLAGYIIKLKNGRDLPTSYFWEQKGEIKFYWANGVAGIQKEEVLSVLQEEEAAEVVILPQMKPALEVRALEPGAEKEKVDMEYYKKQRAFYVEKYERAYERYLEASSRQDKDAKEKAWEEFNRYGGRVISLQEELKIKNGGVLPEWWNQ